MAPNLPHDDLSHQDLSNQDFGFRDLRGWKFNGSDLSHARFQGANLEQAEFCGALLKQSRFCGAQLEGTLLIRADITGADLSGANLRGANLRGADLRKADLTHTDLSQANVQEAVFQGCIGLSKDAKRDLKSRGAILHSSNSDTQWWVETVVVPIAVALIGSGSILGILNFIKPPKPSASPNPSLIKPVIQNSFPTPLGQDKP